MSAASLSLPGSLPGAVCPPPEAAAAVRAVVAIPVRNEAERIAACLHAIDAQTGIPPGSLGVVLFLSLVALVFDHAVFSAEDRDDELAFRKALAAIERSTPEPMRRHEALRHADEERR